MPATHFYRETRETRLCPSLPLGERWREGNGHGESLFHHLGRRFAMTVNLGLVLCALLAIPAYAAETGTALKADAIRAEPFRDAKTVATLAIGDKVEIVKKDGGWLQVISAKGSGWVRMLSVRKGEARKGTGDAAGLLGLASGRAGTGKVVATTGIRGLNEEELKSAQFNADELKLAESYATGKPEAQKFAAQGKLVARKFDYLPAPE